MSLRPAALCFVAVIRFASGLPGLAVGLRGDPLRLPCALPSPVGAWYSSRQVTRRVAVVRPLRLLSWM